MGFRYSRFLLSIVLWATTIGVATAQKVFFSNLDEEGPNVVFDEEWYIKGAWHTNGVYVGYVKGDIISVDRTKYYTLGFSNIQHPREQRQSNDFTFFGGETTKPFKFGKTNHLYVLKGGLGNKKYLSVKARERNVRLAVNYEYGLNVGLVRPYYLNVFTGATSSDRSREDIKYTGDNDDYFLDVFRILGGTGLRNGWDEIKFRPGLHLDGSLIFEFGQNQSRINALELGVMADVFAQRIELMATESNRALFLNLYASFSFGTRN